MSDKKTREYFREGDMTRYHAALLRSGQLTLYAQPAGPPSMLETECATEGCSDKLLWSNCSYCSACHNENCMDPPTERYPNPREHKIGVLIKGGERIRAGTSYACGAGLQGWEW
jgi:hypothetical protein